MERKVKSHKLRNSIFFVIAVFLLVIAASGTTFSIFTNLEASSGYNSIKVGTLELSYDDASGGLGNVINLGNSSPMSDADGMALTSYKFKIENTGNVRVSYKISIALDYDMIEIDECEDKLLDISKIKFKLNNSDSSILVGPSKLNDLYYSSYVYEGYLDAEAQEVFDLRLWIDSGATVADFVDRHFHGKVSLNSSQLINGEAYDIGETACFSYNGTIITDYLCYEGNANSNPIITNLIIPSGATSIATNAFKGKGLKKVSIPSTITSIASGAFENNILEEIKLHSNNLTLSSGAFLKSNTSNPDLNTIYNYAGVSTAFSQAISGTSSTSQAISGYISNTNIAIPARDDCFTINSQGLMITAYSCTNKNLIIPPVVNGYAVSKIGDNAFNSKQLTVAILPDGLTEVGASAFAGNNLTSIVFPNTIVNLGLDSFSKDLATSSNSNLQNVSNKSGRVFDFSRITGGTGNFASGTITHGDGNIIVK